MNMSTPMSRIALLTLSALTFTNANADHGGCPCTTDAEDRNPEELHDVSVTEPAQRAIILWNGNTERLILSTDVSITSDSDAADSLVEFIPLPGRPSVAPTPIDVFGKLVKFASGVDVDLSALLPLNLSGSMSDTFDIEQIERATTLVNRLNRACEIQHSYVAPVAQIAQRYLDRGDRWFVIDKIFVDGAVRSYPPIAYVFPSEQLFYPLDTSTMALGETRIDIVTITPHGISKFGELSTPVQIRSTFAINKDELGQVSENWPEFFGQDRLLVQHWSLEGKLSSMHLDLLAE